MSTDMGKLSSLYLIECQILLTEGELNRNSSEGET